MNAAGKMTLKEIADATGASYRALARHAHKAGVNASRSAACGKRLFIVLETMKQAADRERSFCSASPDTRASLPERRAERLWKTLRNTAGIRFTAKAAQEFDRWKQELYAYYRAEKMRFAEKGKKDAIRYNGSITVSGIPEKAYEYIVNGKSAIEWVMDRYQVRTDPASGIKNDPNDWAIEHGSPRYILDLLLSVITASVKTAEIVSELPQLCFTGSAQGGGQ